MFPCLLALALASLALLTHATPLSATTTPSNPIDLHNLDHLVPVENPRLTFHGPIHTRDLSIHNHRPFQPYPNHITAEYKVYGRVYKFDMKIQSGFVDPDIGYTEYKTEKGETYRVWHEERYYAADNGKAKISAVVLGEESIHAIVDDYANGETFHIESLDFSSLRLPENKRRDLADTKVVAYRQADLKHNGGTCASNPQHIIQDHLDEFAEARDAGIVTERNQRRQVSSSFSPPTRASAADCSTVISGLTRTLIINFAVDWTYYGVFTNTTGVTNSVNSILLSTNFVFVNQFNVKFILGTIYAGTTKGSYPWSDQAYTPASGCTATGYDATAALVNLATWAATQPDATSTTKRIANWHQLTDCFRAPASLQVAYLGTTCSDVQNYFGAINTGVSNFNGASTWLNVAHGLGHNLNAHDSYEQGQGTTGGIMDTYSDRLYPVSGSVRTYRFHPIYNEPEMCTYLKSMLSITNCYGLVSPSPSPSATPSISRSPSLKPPISLPSNSPLVES